MCLGCVLDVIMMVSRTLMLRAPGARFWSKAKWIMRSKMATTTAWSLFLSEMTWAMALLILKWNPFWTLLFLILLLMSSIISSNWWRCCSCSLTMLASKSVFCFWASIAVWSLEIWTVLYVKSVRAEVAAMKEAMSHWRLSLTLRSSSLRLLNYGLYLCIFCRLDGKLKD